MTSARILRSALVIRRALDTLTSREEVDEVLALALEDTELELDEVEKEETPAASDVAELRELAAAEQRARAAAEHANWAGDPSKFLPPPLPRCERCDAPSSSLWMVRCEPGEPRLCEPCYKHERAGVPAAEVTPAPPQPAPPQPAPPQPAPPQPTVVVDSVESSPSSPPVAESEPPATLPIDARARAVAQFVADNGAEVRTKQIEEAFKVHQVTVSTWVRRAIELGYLVRGKRLGIVALNPSPTAPLVVPHGKSARPIAESTLARVEALVLRHGPLSRSQLAAKLPRPEQLGAIIVELGRLGRILVDGDTIHSVELATAEG